MKAWHVQDTNGDLQEIVFAEKRSDAISSSEAAGWTDYINIRAKRAEYADNLENQQDKLLKVLMDNEWEMECSNACGAVIYGEDEYKIIKASIYCENCSKTIEN